MLSHDDARWYNLNNIYAGTPPPARAGRTGSRATPGWQPQKRNRRLRLLLLLLVGALIISTVLVASDLYRASTALLVQVGSQQAAVIDLNQSVAISPYLLGSNVFPRAGTSSKDQVGSGFMSYDQQVMLGLHYAGVKLLRHNEPHAPACWGCRQQALDWRLAAERAGNAILAVNPHWLIFVEGVDCYGPGGVTPGSSASCYWWGGNLQGVKDYPVQLNVAQRLVYSVHDYPSSVHEQPWLTAAAYPNNLAAVWDSYWGYVQKEGIAPVWVGEFGTSMATANDKQWLSSLVNYLGTGAHGFNWTFWCWNPDSTDTGGILNSDWLTVNSAKQEQLKSILFPFVTRATAAPPQQQPGASAGTGLPERQPGRCKQSDPAGLEAHEHWRQPHLIDISDDPLLVHDGFCAGASIRL